MRRRGHFAALLVLSGCIEIGALEPAASTGEASTGEAQDTSGESSSGSGGGDLEGTGESSAGDDSEGATEAESSGSEAGSGSESTATSEAPGSCGDGQVDPGEECDEGVEPTSTCEGCGRVRIIFLTSKLLQGGKINGLTGADAYCRSLALKAKQDLPESPIVDPANFKALLSTSTESVERHHFGTGPYRLVNGLQVSRSFVALFTEPLENPINVTERSETLESDVWTGMDIDGNPYPGIDFCGDWKDLKGTTNFGRSGHVDSAWIHGGVDSDCLSPLPIYCLEQE